MLHCTQDEPRGEPHQRCPWKSLPHGNYMDTGGERPIRNNLALALGSNLIGCGQWHTGAMGARQQRHGPNLRGLPSQLLRSGMQSSQLVVKYALWRPGR
jgi:hypothetical protein